MRNAPQTRQSTVHGADMKLVMIGGHTRNIGKTSVVEGIIRSTAELNWTAVKITQFGHGVCTGECETCSCADNVDQFSITDELDCNTGSDTARFLAAGARRSLWVRTRQGELHTAVPSLKKEIVDDDFVIVESNSLRQFVKPDVYLQVLNPSKSDFKRSARQFFFLSDAYILATEADALVNGLGTMVPGVDQLSIPDTGLLTQTQNERPYFIVTKEDRFIDEQVIEFVTAMLEVGVSKYRRNVQRTHPQIPQIT